MTRCTRVGIVCGALLGWHTLALGQLSADDIAALRERGQREGWTFTVSENPATAYPLNQLCGAKEPEHWQAEARFDPCTPGRDVPAAFDWRNVNGQNLCTPIRSQSGCGSCWAFATMGALECNILIHDGVSVDLSEQYLVSCNSDGWGCSGGWYAHSYHQWKTDACGGVGAVLETDFPYAAQDLPCACPYRHCYRIAGWAYIGSGSGVADTAAIKQAILDHGPVSVGVSANSAMHAYAGGIFNACSSGDINHCVVLVGWNDADGGYWIMRNSWGAGWGEAGYMRILYGCSSIGYRACYVDYQSQDCNYNGVPDPQDISSGTSRDCNGNSVPDECDIAGGGSADANGNGVPDECETSGVSTVYSNITSGATSAFSKPPGTVIGDDLEMTNYGLLKLARFSVCNNQASTTTLHSADIDVMFWDSCTGAPLATITLTNVYLELSPGRYRAVSTGDVSNRHIQLPASILAAVKVYNNVGGDLIGQVLVDPPTIGHSDDHFYIDGGWYWFGGSPVSNFHWKIDMISDCNRNGVPDDQDVALGNSADCNHNGVPDECDFARGTLRDADGNGVADECEVVGDLNCDGALNNQDIDPFVTALFDAAAYAVQYPYCDVLKADFNGDGLVNNQDIDGFIIALFGL